MMTKASYAFLYSFHDMFLSIH